MARRRRTRAGWKMQIGARLVYLAFGALFIIFAIAAASSLGPAFADQVGR